jgi:hypothetical protein
MTSNDAFNIVYGPLDELRSLTHRLTLAFGQADNSTWIRQASRKQLLAEIICLYTNHHQGD